MTRGSCVNWSMAPLKLGSIAPHLGTGALFPLMFEYQKDGSQVIEKVISGS